MKFLVSLFLALFAMSAHAVDFEAGLGLSVAQPVGNGGWYQQNLPYKLDLRSRTWMVGLTDDVAPGWAWHAQLVRLGRFSSDAQACDRDEDYDPVAQAPRATCNVARYRGAGSMLGLAATIERYTMLNDWRVGAEVGPFVYRPDWKVQVDNWQPAKDAPGMTIHYANPHEWQLAAVVGVSAGRGP